MERGERVVLMTRNRPEFHVTDTAAMLVGAVPMSLYNSSSAEQVRYVASHAQAVVAVVDSPKYLERFLKVRDELPRLRHLVIVSNPEAMAPPDVIHFQRLLDAAPADLRTAAQAVQPHDMATLIYTSGTTGPPKAVEITHANVAWTVRSLLEAVGHGITGWRMVSFLPMAHIAERVATHYLHLYQGTEVTTCPDPGFIIEYLREVRPQLVFAVPRVWEKACSSIRALSATDPDQQATFEAALEVGRRVSEAKAAGQALGPALTRDGVSADGVLSVVRDLIGLDQTQLAVTAAAPIAVDVLVFFRALGVPLSELYGLSESTGPSYLGSLPGSTGRRRASHPRLRGAHRTRRRDPRQGRERFAGYLHDPEQTAQTIDPDSWLRTGDLGGARRWAAADRRTQEGPHRHPRRREHLPLQHRNSTSRRPPDRSGLRRRGPPPLPGGAADHRSRRPQSLGPPAGTGCRPFHRAAQGARPGGGDPPRGGRGQPPVQPNRAGEALRHPGPRMAGGRQLLTPTMKVKRRDRVLTKYAAEIDALYQ